MKQRSPEETLSQLQRPTRMVFWFCALLVLVILAWRYFVPLGKLTIRYDVKHGSSYVTNFASKESERLLGTPNTKGAGSHYFQSVTTTPVYFNVHVPRPFQQATVTVQYENPDIQPVLRLGVEQKAHGAYQYRDLAFSQPILDSLPPEWDAMHVGDLFVWQKNKALLALQEQRSQQKQKEIDAFDAQQARALQDAKTRLQQHILTDDDLANLEQQQLDARTVKVAQLESQYAVQPSERPAPQFSSIDAFLKARTEPSTTAEFNYALPTKVNFSNYVPSTTPTVITESIRGTHTIKTIVGKNEPLRFLFTIQDINRHSGKDDFDVQVWSDGAKVAQETVHDIGTSAATGVPTPEQVVTLAPEGLPEGFYTIKVVTSDDIFMKRIESTEHLIKFADRLYLTDNKEYAPVLGDKQLAPSKLFVSGKWVGAETSHDGSLQTVSVGDTSLVLQATQQQEKAEGLSGILPVTVPDNDVLLKTDGDFAFSKDQYFPDPESYWQIDANLDLSKVDFIIANYPKAQQQGDWLVASATMKSPDLYAKDNTIGFILDAPGLPENHRTLNIRSIRIELQKEPWTLGKLLRKLKLAKPS